MTTISALQLEQAGSAAPILEQVKGQLGVIPNIFATMAHSASVLEGFLAFSGSLANGSLSPQLREQIALTVAGVNTCDYCASVHTVMAKGAGVSDEETKLNLAGGASDEKTAEILKFVSSVVSEKGRVPESAVQKIRDQGVNDAELVEILANVGVNIFTNYFNHVADTEIDFPFVSSKPLN